MAAREKRAPVHIRRSWCFVEGASAGEIASARHLVEAFESAQAAGQARVEVGGSLVEVPIYLNARRLLARAAELGVV